VLGAFLATILFSISAISGNRVTRFIGGTEANFWRLTIAALLLGLYAHLLGAGLTGSAFPVFFVSGCIGFGIGDLALFQALPRIGSRLSVMLVLCLSSPMGAALEWWRMKTALSPAQIVSAIVILVGVAIAIAPHEHLHTPRRIVAIGAAFGFIAAICQAVGAVLSREAFALARINGENIDGGSAAYQRILGGVLVTGAFLLAVKRKSFAGLNGLRSSGIPPERADQLRTALPWVLLNGLAGPTLGVSCYKWALKSAPTGIVLPIVATTPVVIMPLAILLEKERPTRRSIIGGIIAVLGAGALATIRSAGK